MLVGAFFQQLYNTVDTVIVGQFAGTEALSSVGGSSATLINLIIGFFTGLSSGCSIVISQFYGAGEQNALRKSVHTAYAFSIAGGILFGVLGILIAPVIFTVLNTPSEIMASSLTYIRIYFAGLVIAGTMSVLVNFYGPFLFRIFTSNEEVIQTGMIMISIFSPFYFSFVFVEQFADSLRAEGCVLLVCLYLSLHKKQG